MPTDDVHADDERQCASVPGSQNWLADPGASFDRFQKVLPENVLLSWIFQAEIFKALMCLRAMRRFFFHLETPDGVETDEIGIECLDVEHAYLRACHAIPDMAFDLLSNRKNPLLYSFSVQNDAGDVLMTVPFTELVQAPPSRHRRQRTQLEAAERHVLAATERLHRQAEFIARLESVGADASLSRVRYALFEQLLESHRTHLERIKAKERKHREHAGAPGSVGQPRPRGGTRGKQDTA